MLSLRDLHQPILNNSNQWESLEPLDEQCKDLVAYWEERLSIWLRHSFLSLLFTEDAFVAAAMCVHKPLSTRVLMIEVAV